MLQDIAVVQSAVSAFNNVALVGPAFLWWALLMLPLFMLVRLYGNDFVARVGWKNNVLLKKVSVWTVGLTGVWVVLFGGNYAVLRDDLSVLPMLTATILFLVSLFVASYMRNTTLPFKGWKRWLLIIAVLIIVGTSDMHVWWGPLLQIGAMLAGVLFGRFSGGEMRSMGSCVLVMMTAMLSILMQPEFFRFGQLGNLTIAHLLAVLVFGISAVGAVVASNVKARGKIGRSLFVKMKWLGRVVCALGAALFLLTEALPVFIGTLIAVACVFAMSVWHEKTSKESLGNKLFAISLMAFGVITVMPVITALGLVYWMNTPDVDFYHEIKVLL
ncbi:MAG: hypothetical protein IKZ34_02495 [Alphaproteobacteria bacterium]|nr:hypothetical protein [Alphaproteobacteria bacterium]